VANHSLCHKKQEKGCPVTIRVPFIMSGIAFLPLQLLLIALDLAVSAKRYARANTRAFGDAPMILNRFFSFVRADLIFDLWMAQSNQKAYQEAIASNCPFGG
jgi:hypothetical protein